MNIAIIDVGSNNIKLEIYSLDSKNKTELQYTDKVSARLGHLAFTQKKLHPDSITIGIKALSIYKSIIDTYECKHVIALGTSALREVDSTYFIKKVKQKIGIKIKVISGAEEARLVYLGACQNLKLNSSNMFLLNDIGGGSTEIALFQKEQIFETKSLRLGTIRLKDLFEEPILTIKKNKVSLEYEDYIKQIQDYIKQVLRVNNPYIKTSYRADIGISTGGTANNIHQIIQTKQEYKSKEILYRKDLKKFIKEWMQTPLKNRKNLKGLDVSRVDIILHGAILLWTIMRIYAIKSTIICSQGLRNGVLLDFISKQQNNDTSYNITNKAKQYAIQVLQSKYIFNIKQAREYAKLTKQLFIEMYQILDIDLKYLLPLESACLLHNIGTHISYLQYPQNSAYIIKTSQLEPFLELEKEIIICIALHHNKGNYNNQKRDNLPFSSNEIKVIMQLLSISKIAYAFMTADFNIIKCVSLKSYENNRIIINITSKKEDKLLFEILNAGKKKQLFEKVFDKQIQFVVLQEK